MSFKRILRFVKENYFISIFGLIILFVGIISFFKIFNTKPTYVYAKVKLGQGLWWAGGQKPGIWLATSIKKGDVERDLTGRSIVEVLNVRYYPWYNIDQYDVYLTLKLKVSKIGRANKYNFKRNSLGVGAPIELELPSVQVSGTVIEISQKPFQEKYTDKTIILSKQYAYPWEFNAIKIGEKFFNGENTAFEVIDKTEGDVSRILSPQRTSTSNILSGSVFEQRQSIGVKAKIKVKEVGDQLIFGEEQRIYVGKTLNILTSSFSFTDFVIAGIE